MRPVFVNKLGFADPYGSTSHAVDALFTDGKRAASNGMVVVRVGPTSPLLTEVIDVLGRGECGTGSTAPDPLLDWVFAGTDAQSMCKPLSSPPDKDRVAWFRWMAHYCAAFAMARGGLYALVNPGTGKVLAGAVTGPPRTISFGRMSGGEMGDNIREAGMAIGIDILANNMRMRALGAWQHGIQESYGLGDSTNFLYLVMFATAPEAQGQGCGKALLNFLGEVADADGVTAFLETAGTRNIGFYGTGGYHEVTRSPCATFTHEGGGVGMARLPTSNPGRAATALAIATEGQGVTATKRQDSTAAKMQDTASQPAKCHFSPKRPHGPLSSYCRNCGHHISKCQR